MDDFTKSEFVKDNFRSLQGLQSLPIGLVFLILACNGLLGSSGWSNWLNVILLAVVLVLAGWSFFFSAAYYRRKYGSSFNQLNYLYRPDETFRQRLFLALLTLLILVGALVVDYTVRPPVSLALIVFAIAIVVGVTLVYSFYRLYYLAVAVIVIGIALYPLLNNSVNRTNLFFLGLATFFIIGGVGDHLLLTRTLKPANKS